MKGLTNATNTSNDAKGDVVYAVNNTGGDILAQQKVWLNKHNNTDLESSWISGGYSSYISGFALFFNANNNFLALSRAATAFYALYDNDDKTWTLNTVSVTPSVLNNLVAYNNFIEAENCYYGFYINNTAVKSMASVTVDGNFTVKTYEDEIVLSEQWAFKKTDTDYVFEVVDRINTSRPHISFNFSEYQENIYTVLLDNDNEFLFITKSEIDNEVRFRKTEICWNKTDWLLLTPLGKYPRVEPYITQPTIKYFTGIDNGDYLITTSSVIDDSWNKRYNLIIYKITNDGVVIAQDLPTDLHNLIDKPCLVRYDKRTKRLYISNDADFYMFVFDGTTFVLQTLDFDKTNLIVPYEGSYNFSVSDDRTTIAIQAQTSVSSGKFNVLKLTTPDDDEWYAENYAQVNAYSLTGYCTGKTDGLGRAEIRTALPEVLTFSISFTPDVETFELSGGVQ